MQSYGSLRISCFSRWRQKTSEDDDLHDGSDAEPILSDSDCAFIVQVLLLQASQDGMFWNGPIRAATEKFGPFHVKEGKASGVGWMGPGALLPEKMFAIFSQALFDPVFAPF